MSAAFEETPVRGRTVTGCGRGVRVSAASGDPCDYPDCTGKRTTKSDYCDRHTHDWVAAAEVPIENRIVAGAVRRAQVNLDEGTLVRVLDVYCGTCRQMFGEARGTPCDMYSPVLRGGPLGTRRRREDQAAEG